jgi:tetratricopeptide (TPR) repeat protein
VKSLVVVMLLATIAHADDRTGAERYFRAGASAYSAQNFAAAAADFDEAYKAMPLPEIAFSAAQAYRRLYRVEPKPEYVQRAVELYRAYLDKVKTGGRVGDAADSLGELQRELDRLKLSATPLTVAPQVAHTRLGVSVTISDQHTDTGALHEIGDATGPLTPGLVATLDGKPLEPFALVDVAAAEHVIAVRADGYEPVAKHAVAIAGQSQLIEIELQPKPATVAVATDSGAHIAVDGRQVATSPTPAIDVAAGKHLLTITLSGHEPFGRELAVARGQALTIHAPLAKTARRKAVPWLVGASGVLAAGAIATAIVAIERDSKTSDLRTQIDAGDRAPSDGDAYDADVRSRDHFVDATWALGATAVVAGAAGLALYFFDEPSAERLRVVPIASATGGGAMLTGRF